jgi:N-methylhydantoinase A
LPGPAAYGLGGTAATVTDANVVLGYLNPTGLAGGSVAIHRELAERAVTEQVAAPLGRGPLEAAWAAHAVANVRMIGAIKTVSSERGYDPRAFTLIAFGGNGPVHAVGVSRVLVPPAPGLFSAFGLLFTDHKRHSSRTYFRAFPAVDLVELNGLFASLEAAALAEFAADGIRREDLAFERAADLRYVGQGFELTLPVPEGTLDAAGLTRLETAFHAAHTHTYGHASEADAVQFVTLRLTVRNSGRVRSVVSAGWGSDHRHLVPPGTMRDAYFGEAGVLRTPVINRNDLTEQSLAGPLIVEEYDATTVVPPGAVVRLDAAGNIVIDLDERS